MIDPNEMGDGNGRWKEKDEAALYFFLLKLLYLLAIPDDSVFCSSQ